MAVTYEFRCKDGHVTPHKFKSISEATGYYEDPFTFDTFTQAQCAECSKVADRVYDITPTLFLGSGWDRPAPSGKVATKGVDATKAISSLGPAVGKGHLGSLGRR